MRIITLRILLVIIIANLMISAVIHISSLGGYYSIFVPYFESINAFVAITSAVGILAATIFYKAPNTIRLIREQHFLLNASVILICVYMVISYLHIKEIYPNKVPKHLQLEVSITYLPIIWLFFSLAAFYLLLLAFKHISNNNANKSFKFAHIKRGLGLGKKRRSP